MNLPDNREPIVRHALHEVELPQRLTAIQCGAGDFSDRGIELAATPGSPDLQAPDVVVEVDVAVLQPHCTM